jgi:hypothetical protein
LHNRSVFAPEPRRFSDPARPAKAYSQAVVDAMETALADQEVADINAFQDANE